MQQTHRLGIAWFRKEGQPFLAKETAINFRSFIEGDVINFGDLEEVELERKNLIGYIQFWSRGMVGYGACDRKGNIIIEDKMTEVDDSPDFKLILQPILKAFS